MKTQPNASRKSRNTICVDRHMFTLWLHENAEHAKQILRDMKAFAKRDGQDMQDAMDGYLFCMQGLFVQECLLPFMSQDEIYQSKLVFTGRFSEAPVLDGTNKRVRSVEGQFFEAA
jgi:hypothetical protein